MHTPFAEPPLGARDRPLRRTLRRRDALTLGRGCRHKGQRRRAGCDAQRQQDATGQR